MNRAQLNARAIELGADEEAVEALDTKAAVEALIDSLEADAMQAPEVSIKASGTVSSGPTLGAHTPKKGSSLTTTKGLAVHGDEIFASDLSGGESAFALLKAKGYLVEL